MARNAKQLKKTQIDNAKPTVDSLGNKKVKKLYDGDGLCLKVNSSGTKVWLFEYTRKSDGKRTSITLGEYIDNLNGLTIVGARAKRDEYKTIVDRGEDPVQVRANTRKQKNQQQKLDKEKAEQTFESYAKKLYENKQKRQISIEYRDRMYRQLEIHMFPKFGKRYLGDITPKELREHFDELAGKTNNQGKPMTYMARKICQWSGEVFKLYSIDSGSLVNPCSLLPKVLPKHETQGMRRIPIAQLPEFLQALDAYGGNEVTKRAIWLMLYTGVRQISIRRMKWRDVDLKNKVWNRQPEKGDKNVLPLPLPEQAEALLKKNAEKHPSGPDNYVFPSPYGNNKLMMSEASITQAIRRMGFDMTGHSLRGLVVTGLNEKGYDHRWIELQVGHTIRGVEKAYNDARYLDQRRDMMKKWADYLDDLRKG